MKTKMVKRRRPDSSPRPVKLWQLRLYVASQTPKSLAAFSNLKKICENHLKGCYRIEVIDLLEHPHLCKGDQILPTDTELTLYRILQEALRNVERHARARHVTVCLTQQNGFTQLTINDDGIGFDSHHPAKQKGKEGLGLLGMRERATYVGGTLKIKSARRAGTRIEVRVPLPPKAIKASGLVLFARRRNQDVLQF